MHLRFLEQEDEQSGRRDAVENDGVDEVDPPPWGRSASPLAGRGGHYCSRDPWESSSQLSSHRRRS